MAVPQRKMIDHDRRERWLAERRTCVTGSDIAPILGVGAFGKTRMDVYLDKMAMAEREQTERQRWGLKLQRAILEEYAERTGRAIELSDEYTLVRHPTYPFLGATLDGRLTGNPDRRPVDAKNVGIKTSEWGEEGTDQIPHQYALQLHVQMMVLDEQCADLAVLFGGNSLVIYTVHRDPEIDAIIVKGAREFYENHIEAAIPPAVDGSPAWSQFLQKHVRFRSGDMLMATEEQDAEIKKLLRVRGVIERLEERQALLENRLKSAIGDKYGIAGTLAEVKWPQSKDGTTTAWQDVANTLRNAMENLALGMNQNPGTTPEDISARVRDLFDGIVKRFTAPKPGSRRFVVSPRKTGVKGW